MKFSGQKLTFFALHLLEVVVLFYWLLPGLVESSPAAERNLLVLACAVGYLLRGVATLFVFLRRDMPWFEVGIVTVWIGFIYAVFGWLTAGNAAPPGPAAWTGTALYGFGSFLNTWSEYQRYRFKQNPANAGRLFTGGLFRYSMHVNYLGDVVLFSGFALVVGSLWAAIIPVLMTCSFLFQHIPHLDRYLSERYGDQFTEYADRTAKFVPFLY